MATVTVEVPGSAFSAYGALPASLPGRCELPPRSSGIISS